MKENKILILLTNNNLLRYHSQIIIKVLEEKGESSISI